MQGASEKTSYCSKKHPFYYYLGFISGCIIGYIQGLAVCLVKIFQLLIRYFKYRWMLWQAQL